MRVSVWPCRVPPLPLPSSMLDLCVSTSTCAPPSAIVKVEFPSSGILPPPPLFVDKYCRCVATFAAIVMKMRESGSVPTLLTKRGQTVVLRPFFVAPPPLRHSSFSRDDGNFAQFNFLHFSSYFVESAATTTTFTSTIFFTPYPTIKAIRFFQQRRSSLRRLCGEYEYLLLVVVLLLYCYEMMK
eukprot:GHVU01112089.1.p1 GENE.GHVU01112089.1~~GHVU01112089.1.p1  ORF type:complete len:184 (+),score=12.52 GHVU01112089.1:653-1204(+)